MQLHGAVGPPGTTKRPCDPQLHLRVRTSETGEPGLPEPHAQTFNAYKARNSQKPNATNMLTGG